ncbi:hypothetical protein [Helicobacter heilmannii]|uniref:hypothetical protein n=1 Tax=Helicobacter heilmannii TaxID=35817 RepID=UPI0006A121C3|nr:hypothetical protein [Helicobacter heilmannii]GMB94013.1 Membrane protein [Helicobacter heilmannii]CRF45377.1 hypothetical protein HHE014_03400 [Helicobacter heilmannii]CRF47607.1 hypothetical protein HHE02_08980 [Helicobacter heilmannii]CRF49046.1 hypothetical protein HHE03_06430 [Helicobacter heilmannii]
MKLSYSNPFPKHTLSLLAKVWLMYIFLAVGAVYGVAYFLQVYIAITKNRAEISQVQGHIYSYEAKRIEKRIEHTKQILTDMRSKAVYTLNVRDSIKGVLEMIPDSITIKSITIDYSSLVLQGIVPSKENFKSTIQQRLNSIFENSHVEFTRLSNGWYSFISINSSVLPFIEKAHD